MAGVFRFDDVGMHAAMLLDPVRMRAFADAIARAVRPDDVVIDVGSGSGVLALLCAKAGARRVYAVEHGPMAQLIEGAARHNGVGDVVRVHRGDVRDVRFGAASDGGTPGFDERPTLIVSEILGSFGLDEDWLGIIGAVRAQCAPGCRVLPAAVTTHLALAAVPALDEELDTLRGGLGVALDDVAAMMASRVVSAWVDAASLVSEPIGARFEVGMRPPKVLDGVVRATRDARVNAIVAWFTAALDAAGEGAGEGAGGEREGGASLSTHPAAPRTHWAHLVFPLHPALDVAAGAEVALEVRPRLLTDRGTWAWRARTTVDGQAHTRSGDAMRALVGTRDDVLRQLGIRAPTLDPRASERLPLWAAALSGGVADTAALAARLRAAFPERYADDDDAAAEIARLVRAAS